VDGGFVADGELVVPGRDGAVAFETVDAALHGVALAVDDRVESGWPSAFPFAAPGRVLLGLAGDRGFDAAAAFAREV
jgi:hypothetical protein